jgi:hypothetical protein
VLELGKSGLQGTPRGRELIGRSVAESGISGGWNPPPTFELVLGRRNAAAAAA